MHERKKSSKIKMPKGKGKHVLNVRKLEITIRMRDVLILFAEVIALMTMTSIAIGQISTDNELHVPGALYILGDSSVDCGDNTLFYPILHHNLSLLPCNGSSSSLLPYFLAKKIGLPHTPSFYSQNGSLEGLLSGLNYGSAQATIMNPSSATYQSLNEQLRQLFETLQLLQLQLTEERAPRFINSSIFYLSFGKDDYIDLLLRNSVGALYNNSSSLAFTQMLVDQMAHAMRSLYDWNVRKIICMGILPLGCTPRILLEWHTSSTDDHHQDAGYGVGCVEEINRLVLEYNTMLEKSIAELNQELQDVQIVFCDVYQGIMDIITNPTHYGFEDTKNACCGLGEYGATIGCLSADMACDEADHVWWDLYNPTEKVNSLLADSAWAGQPFSTICRPITLHHLLPQT